MQTWFPRTMNGIGIWWRVDFSKPRHELYQQPQFDDSIEAHNAQYRQRMQQFFLLGTMPKEKEPQPIATSSPLSGIPIPKDPLAEAWLMGTQLKDDCNAFVEAANWRQAFKKLPYVEAMRTMTMQPKPTRLRKVQLHDVADKANELSEGVFTAKDEAIL
jgi:hypothetical protein